MKLARTQNKQHEIIRIQQKKYENERILVQKQNALQPHLNNKINYRTQTLYENGKKLQNTSEITTDSNRKQLE